MATVNYIPYKKQSAFTLRGVIGYVCQKSKTLLQDGPRLITGQNCCAETAVFEFLSTKAQYQKVGDVQFYHYTQSFKVGENITPQTAHEIACEFARKNYPDYEVLIATHTDAPHIHSHLIINSVSFENGRKLHQAPYTIRRLRLSSDEICQAHGFEILPTYTFGRSKTPSRAQRRAQARGDSWKDKLQQAIDVAMVKSKTREDFIFNMERQGYFVKWSDTRKTITYTCPNGKPCRDGRLFGERYSKTNMELEFNYREQKKEPEQTTGWDWQRDALKPKSAPVVDAPAPRQGIKLTDEILHHAKYLEQGVSEDDELETITELAALTALSFAGIYLLLDAIANADHEQINDQNLTDFIDELQQEPENCMGYEDEQEQFGFTMTMM
jgi:hypothetical protein